MGPLFSQYSDFGIDLVMSTSLIIINITFTYDFQASCSLCFIISFINASVQL